MEDISYEKYIKNSIEPKSIEGKEKILFQMKNTICKIHKKNGIFGSGFFCKIKYNENELLPILITNNHVLNENDIKDNNIIFITINDEEESKRIKMDNSRKKFTSQQLDITIIEIKPNEDNINKFLEIDKNIYKDQYIIENTFIKKSIYILHYPNGKNMNVSFGLISNIKEDKINHLCNTENGSSGSPILSLDTFNVIGIHNGSYSGSKNYNVGMFIKNAINRFIQETNMKIYIKNKNMKTFSFYVEPDCTIEKIKYKIKNKIKDYNFHLNDINLKYTNDFLENEKTLKEYNIKNESFIQLDLRDDFIVIVSYFGKTLYSISTHESETIMEFKNKIYYENFILPEMQKLIYAGKVLDDYKNLKESKVGHGAKIHLFYTKEHTNIQIDFFLFKPNQEKLLIFTIIQMILLKI